MKDAANHLKQVQRKVLQSTRRKLVEKKQQQLSRRRRIMEMEAEAEVTEPMTSKEKSDDKDAPLAVTEEQKRGKRSNFKKQGKREPRHFH